jgi:hypothetical protein
VEAALDQSFGKTKPAVTALQLNDIFVENAKVMIEGVAFG